MNYDDYMKSVEWEEKRQLRLRMDGFRCFKCGTAVNLQVHHITYERLGHERMGDLITLCEPCHKRLHEPKRKEKKEREPLLVAAAGVYGFNKEASSLFEIYFSKAKQLAEYKILNIKDSEGDYSELLQQLKNDVDLMKQVILEIDPDFEEGVNQ